MKLFFSAVSLSLALFAGTAQALSVTVTCPGAGTYDPQRTFSLTSDPASTCLGGASGTDSLADIHTLTGNSDYILIDKSDGSGGALDGALTASSGSLTSGLSGSVSINSPGFLSRILVFKSGEGQLDPDWVAFLLPDGLTFADWSISGKQELSHTSLYGIVAPVPLPAAGGLLFTALGVMGVFRLRRRKSAI